MNRGGIVRRGTDLQSCAFHRFRENITPASPSSAKSTATCTQSGRHGGGEEEEGGNKKKIGLQSQRDQIPPTFSQVIVEEEKGAFEFSVWRQD